MGNNLIDGDPDAVYQAQCEQEQREGDWIRWIAEEFVEDFAAVWRRGDGAGSWILQRIAEAVQREYPHLFPEEETRPPSLRKPISSSLRKCVFERDEYRCKQCGTHIDLSVDHVVAVANGGTNDLDNLQTLCTPCNSRKGPK